MTRCITSEADAIITYINFGIYVRKLVLKDEVTVTIMSLPLYYKPYINF